MIRWSGIFHILATPFGDDGAIDTAAHLVDRALSTGLSGAGPGILPPVGARTFGQPRVFPGAVDRDTGLG